MNKEPRTGTKKTVMDKVPNDEFQLVSERYTNGSDEVRLYIEVRYGVVECFNTLLKFLPNGNLNNCKIFLN